MEVVSVDITRDPWWVRKPRGSTDDQALVHARGIWSVRLSSSMRRVYRERLYELANCRLIVGPRTHDRDYAYRYRDLLEEIAGNVMEDIEAGSRP